MPLPPPGGRDLCQHALKSVHSFSKYSVHKLVTDERSKKWTDEGQVKNIMRAAILDWRTDKYSICSLTVLRLCFYHPVRVQSAIAKFLVYLLQKGEGRCEIGERTGRGRECEENGGCGKWKCKKKITPKRNRFGIWGRRFGATAACHTVLESSFQEQHFNRTYYVSILTHLKVIKLQTWQYFQSRHRNSKYCAKHFRQIFSRATLASLYLEPFRSSLASKLTVLEKSTYGLLGDGSYPHKLYIFRKLFSRDTFASKIVRLYLQPLKGCKASKLTMLKNVTYFAMWRGTLGVLYRPMRYIFRKVPSSWC